MNNNSSVFVCTEGFTTQNPVYSYTTTLSGTTALGSVSAHLTESAFRANPITKYQTYNDFWKFDEEFDLLWKSFFDPSSGYRPIKEKIVSHPCDIQETDEGLRIDIAAVGLDRKDLDIIVDSETLRIAYRKAAAEEAEEKNQYRYFQRSIKKASFDIAWKISSKFDLNKLQASLDKGLLTLDIPFAKENRPKKIEIKTKELLKG